MTERGTALKLCCWNCGGAGTVYHRITGFYRHILMLMDADIGKMDVPVDPYIGPDGHQIDDGTISLPNPWVNMLRIIRSFYQGECARKQEDIDPKMLMQDMFMFDEWGAQKLLEEHVPEILQGTQRVEMVEDNHKDEDEYDSEEL